MALTRILSLTISFFVFCFTVEAQINDLKGFVIDSLSGEALQYASIAIKGKNTGTTSNTDGSFGIPSVRIKKGDSLVFNYMGYEQKTIEIEPFIDSVPPVIKLLKQAYDLPTLLVLPMEIEALFDSLRNNIPKNYPKHNMRQKMFYRQWAQQNENGIYAEALLDVYKNSYASKKLESHSAFIKGRQFDYIEDSDDRLFINSMVNPSASASADPVRALPDFMQKKTLKKYDFRIADIVMYEGRRVYKIVFDQKSNLKEALLAGELYIDTDNFALVKGVWRLSEKGRPYIKVPFKARMAMKLLGIEFEIYDFDFTFLYRPSEIGYVMYQNASNAHFKVERPKKKQHYNFKIHNEVSLVEMLEYPGNEIPENKRYSSDNTEWDIAEGKYDISYWKGYPMVAPSQTIQKILEQLAQRKTKYKSLE